MARNRRIDEALEIPKRGIWIATVVILLGGLVVMVWTLNPTEQRRRQIMERTAIGDQAEHVSEMIAQQPVQCPGGNLIHLRDAFPEGWSPAAVDVTLERLADETRERWVYAVDRRRTAGCEARTGMTEIGIDQQGRVLWYVAIHGRTSIRLPEELTPSGPMQDPDEEDDQTDA